MHKGELRLEEVSAKAIDGFDLSRDRTCNLEFIRTAGHPPSYFHFECHYIQVRQNDDAVSQVHISRLTKKLHPICGTTPVTQCTGTNAQKQRQTEMFS